ncbi:hypothetical protein ABPG74_010879 [Tetrahymena malaccensis]
MIKNQIEDVQETMVSILDIIIQNKLRDDKNKKNKCQKYHFKNQNYSSRLIFDYFNNKQCMYLQIQFNVCFLQKSLQKSNKSLTLKKLDVKKVLLKTIYD